MTNPNDLVNTGFHGLTKREYFASIALQGILSSPALYERGEMISSAINIADALIDKLNEKSK